MGRQVLFTMTRILLGFLLTVLFGVLVAGCSRLGPYDDYDLRGIWKGYTVFDDATQDTTRIQMEVIEQHINPWQGPRPISATGTFTFFMPDGTSTSYPLRGNDIGDSEKFILDITVEQIVGLFMRGYVFYGNVNNQEISGTYRYFEKGDKDGKDPLHLYRREGTWYVARL
jgi:hypothetical protein